MGSEMCIRDSCDTLYGVAPLVGAWIEIREIKQERAHYPSLPSWERGLKLNALKRSLTKELVAPLVGAWIEIDGTYTFGMTDRVAPLVGAWIEIERE